MPLEQAEAPVPSHHFLCNDCSWQTASCDAISSQVNDVCSADFTLHLQDTTFEMERQRNKPVKYNREMVHKSVKAMHKVEEVCSSTILNSKSSLQRLQRLARLLYRLHWVQVSCTVLRLETA